MLIVVSLFPSGFLFCSRLKQGPGEQCRSSSLGYQHDKHIKVFLHSSGVCDVTSQAKPGLLQSLRTSRLRKCCCKVQVRLVLWAGAGRGHAVLPNYLKC